MDSLLSYTQVAIAFSCPNALQKHVYSYLPLFLIYSLCLSKVRKLLHRLTIFLVPLLLTNGEVRWKEAKNWFLLLRDLTVIISFFFSFVLSIVSLPPLNNVIKIQSPLHSKAQLDCLKQVLPFNWFMLCQTNFTLTVGEERISSESCSWRSNYFWNNTFL